MLGDDRTVQQPILEKWGVELFLRPQRCFVYRI
jgi:hypothetical protein